MLQVLKDESLTLFQSGLCPAANLFFGSQLPGGPFLRPEVLALKGAVPKASEPEVPGPPENRAPAPSESSVAPQSGGAAGVDESGRKVPKWLKLKK